MFVFETERWSTILCCYRKLEYMLTLHTTTTTFLDWIILSIFDPPFFHTKSFFLERFFLSFVFIHFQCGISLLLPKSHLMLNLSFFGLLPLAMPIGWSWSFAVFAFALGRFCLKWIIFCCFLLFPVLLYYYAIVYWECCWFTHWLRCGLLQNLHCVHRYVHCELQS